MKYGLGHEISLYKSPPIITSFFLYLSLKGQAFFYLVRTIIITKIATMKDRRQLTNPLVFSFTFTLLLFLNFKLPEK